MCQIIKIACSASDEIILSKQEMHLAATAAAVEALPL